MIPEKYVPVVVEAEPVGATVVVLCLWVEWATVVVVIKVLEASVVVE